MRAIPIVAAILSLGLIGSAVAQDSSQAPKTTIVDSSTATHLGAEAPTLAMGSDTISRNMLVFGVSMGGAYDTRGLYNYSTNNFSGSARYFVQPSIAYQRTESTGSYTLSYTPGFSYSPDDQNNNQYTQNAAGDVSWRPSYRWQVHGRQDYSRTENPFETVGRVDLLPGLGGPLGPNYSGIVPSTRRTEIVSNLDLTYSLSEHSSLGFTGGYQKTNYDSTAASTASFSYENSQVINGSFFLSHQFSEHFTAGVQATYADYYSTGQQTTRVQAPAPLLFLKYMPSSHVEFTFYGGPQASRLHERYVSGGITYQEPTTTNWYPNIGATLAFSQRRQAFSISADERVSNGGGVLSAVRVINAEGGYRVRLLEHLLAEGRVNYGDQRALGSFAKGDDLRSVWVGGGPVVELSRSWSLRGEVAYVHQEERGLSPVAGNHLLAQGSLDFRFKKNLGD